MRFEYNVKKIVFHAFYFQVDDEGVVDYGTLVSLIPEAYYDRVTKMLFSCKHLGKTFV